GNVFQSVPVPLTAASSAWIHIAGGYDATTGAITLYVNGVRADSTNGRPGAHSSDANPVAIGTVKNGGDFVRYAARTFIDEVQLYDGPLSAAEVAALRENPARVTDELTRFPAKLLAHWKFDEPN